MLCLVANVGGKQTWSNHECKMTRTILCQAIIEKTMNMGGNMLFLFEIDYHFCNFESMLHVACCMKPWAETRTIALNFQHCLLWSLSCQMPAFSQRNYRHMSTNEDTWRFFALHRDRFYPWIFASNLFALVANWTSSGLMPCLLRHEWRLYTYFCGLFGRLHFKCLWKSRLHGQNVFKL